VRNCKIMARSKAEPRDDADKSKERKKSGIIKPEGISRYKCSENTGRGRCRREKKRLAK